MPSRCYIRVCSKYKQLYSQHTQTRYLQKDSYLFLSLLLFLIPSLSFLLLLSFSCMDSSSSQEPCEEDTAIVDTLCKEIRQQSEVSYVTLSIF